METKRNEPANPYLSFILIRNEVLYIDVAIQFLYFVNRVLKTSELLKGAKEFSQDLVDEWFWLFKEYRANQKQHYR